MHPSTDNTSGLAGGEVQRRHIVVKAIVVVFVIILYSEQARDFVRRAIGRTRTHDQSVTT